MHEYFRGLYELCEPRASSLLSACSSVGAQYFHCVWTVALLVVRMPTIYRRAFMLGQLRCALCIYHHR